ncbi:hypothetical protein C8Q74DRAFT_1266281 [Fomes fomentarius]|nr:hypothetical protein C8Q74DRAFT_1266281 [Fomes fomentarius]
MVFARLTPADKDAFFALLDEYFASRPDLFAGNGNGGVEAAGRAAAVSAVSHAFSSAPSVPATNGWKRPDPAATEEISNSVGRVAAAAAAFRTSSNGAPPTPAQNGFPRPPPRRNPSSSEDTNAPAEHSKLMPARKFGDVDMSSGKNMFSSIRNSTAMKSAPPPQIAPPTPPAFQRRNDFAPPPRRVPSTGASTPSPAPTPSPGPPPALPRRATQQESGEWAEALYEYSSDDPGDLPLQEGARVLVVERTSEDWWTGEIEGRRGLIPAAYVKVL